MPKKKKKTTKSKGSRRVGRASAMGSPGIMTLAGAVVGGVVTKVSTKIAAEKLPDTDRRIINGAPLVVGGFVAWNPLRWNFLNSPFIQGFGLGMAAVGGLNVATDLKVIGRPNPNLFRRVAGPGNIPQIGQGPNTNIAPFVGQGGNPGSIPQIGRTSRRRRFAATH